MDSPQGVVVAFGTGGRTERRHLDALRVDPVEDAADDTVLPGGVEPLEDEDDTPPVLGEEEVLQFVDPLAELRQILLGLVLLETEHVGRVALCESGLVAGLHLDVIEHRP